MKTTLATLVLPCAISIFSATAVAEVPADKPPASENVKNTLQELENRLDTLEAYVNRLNGYKAAVIDSSSEGNLSALQGTTTESEIRIVFCGTTSYEICDEGTPGSYILSTGFFGETAESAIFSFDESNTANFSEVQTLLTNGIGTDRISFYRETCADTCSSSGRGGTDKSFFFRQMQPSTGVGFDDLSGLDINRISVSVDRYSEFYNEAEGRINYFIQYTVFFEVGR